MSETGRGARGWRGSQNFLLTILLIAPLMYLSGCGSGQTDVGQANGNSVPVSLSISMPQESAAAVSTVGNRFWATVQSWLPSVTNAWAVTYDLSELTVTVTDSDQRLLTTKTEKISSLHESSDSIPIDLEVPVGSNRVFTVVGIDRLSGELRLHGESDPITLTAGQAAVVEVILTNVTGTGTVTGTVTNVGTGIPLPNATVTVNGTRLSTITLDNGTFTLNGIPQGRQTLTISASGFTSTTRDATVVAGTSVSAGTIALTPLRTTGTITGIVTNASGKPLVGIEIILEGANLKTKTQSPKGNFNFNDVLPGPQILSFNGFDFYESKTKAVTVVAGSTADGSISLAPLLTTGAITGTVTNSDKPVINTQVFVMKGSEVVLSSSTDSTGGFSFEAVPEGSYVLVLNGFKANKPVTVTKQTTVDGSIDVGATGTITGTVKQPTFRGPTIPLSGATVAVNGTNPTISTTTNSDGNFTLDLVPVGMQTLTASKGRCYSTATQTVIVAAGDTVSGGEMILNEAIECPF